MRQYGKYFAGLIALYLVVANAGAKDAFSAGATGLSDVTKALQGRG